MILKPIDIHIEALPFPTLYITFSNFVLVYFNISLINWARYSKQYNEQYFVLLDCLPLWYSNIQELQTSFPGLHTTPPWPFAIQLCTQLWTSVNYDKNNNRLYLTVIKIIKIVILRLYYICVYVTTQYIPVLPRVGDS